MQKWRSPYLVGMAFVALLATMLPSLAWACPMTGRVGDGATVCLLRASTKSHAMPCCMPGHDVDGDAVCKKNCCKAIPRAPRDDGNQTAVLPSGAEQILAVLVHSRVSSRDLNVSLAYPASAALLAPILRIRAFEAPPADLSLASQRLGSTRCGRAPPV